jgi:FtsH-binding integral membrane protein
VFFISAAAFGALSIWGYTTQRSSSGFGTFLFMGRIGIIIASLVNLFLRSSGLDWMISIFWRLCGPHGLLRHPADKGDVRPRR